MSQSPAAPPSSGTAAQRQARSTPLLALLAIVSACVLAIGGGFLTGLAIENFGMLGAVTLIGVGAVGGYGWRYATKTPLPIAGYSIAAACFVALYLGEASWYRATYTIPDPVTGVDRDPTWVESFQRVPIRLWQRGRPALGVGVLSAFLGAGIAFREAGRRYRMVMIADD